MFIHEKRATFVVVCALLVVTGCGTTSSDETAVPTSTFLRDITTVPDQPLTGHETVDSYIRAIDFRKIPYIVESVDPFRVSIEMEGGCELLIADTGGSQPDVALRRVDTIYPLVPPPLTQEEFRKARVKSTAEHRAETLFTRESLRPQAMNSLDMVVFTAVFYLLSTIELFYQKQTH